jgi:hypothetical protein
MLTTQELFKNYQVKVSTSPKSEYGDLMNYFIGLGLKKKDGQLLKPSTLGFLISPFVRGTKEERNYSLLYALRTACQNSKNPCACFWAHVKPKKK